MSDERNTLPSSSALDRLVQCSASHNMGILADSLGNIKEEAREDALFGIRVHKALEEGTGKALETDEERLAFSIMSRACAKFTNSWLRPGGITELLEHHLEHRLWLYNGVTPIFSGKADSILIQGERALILDFKSLWNRVPEPADNHQLKSLATLLWCSNNGLKEITIHIIAAHHEYSPYVMGEKECASYLEFLRERLTLVNQANAPQAGGWCKHCPGMLICPAIRKKASDLVRADEDESWPAKLPLGAPGAKILDEMSALSSLIDRVKDHYKTVLSSNPKAVPGWTLATRTTRKFKDIGHVFRMLDDKYGPRVFDYISINVSQALEDLSPTEQKTLEEYVEKTVSAPFLKKGKSTDGLEEI